MFSHTAKKVAATAAKASRHYAAGGSCSYRTIYIYSDDREGKEQYKGVTDHAASCLAFVFSPPAELMLDWVPCNAAAQRYYCNFTADLLTQAAYLSFAKCLAASASCCCYCCWPLLLHVHQL